MAIYDLDKNILENGFIMPKFSDGIKVIWYDNIESSFYRIILLLFYLLGCFQIKFYQYRYKYGRETIRCVLFHPINWNPISLIAKIIFQAMNYFCGKEIIIINVNPKITINVRNNQAYIV